MGDPSYEELLAATRRDEKNAQIVRNAIDALNSGVVPTFLSYFHENMRFQMNGAHNFSRTCHSRDEFTELVGEVAAGLSEMITLEIESLHTAGDWVICETNGQAKTHAQEPYCNRYCMLWKIEDGKVSELREYNDSAMVERTFFT